MRALRRLTPIALAAAALFGAARDAHAIVIERVVAVIGDKPILQSELRARSVPFLAQLEEKVPEGPQRTAAVSQMNKELLQKMVDEELMQQQADRSKIVVSADDVDNAFKNLAANQGLTVSQLFVLARKRAGMTEAYYRDEIKRQILEGKMLQLRVKGRARITDQDLRQTFEQALKEERKHLAYHPAWIVIRIYPGSSPEAVEERKHLAIEIAERARRGEAFDALAKRYSDDTQTRETGGDIGVRAPNGSQAAQEGRHPVIAPELEAAVTPLAPGEVAMPIKAGENFIVLKLLSREPSQIKGFEESKPYLMQIKSQEILEREKKKWLEELKARTPVVIRL